MPVFLQRVRLIITTQDSPGAGTDAEIHLYYKVAPSRRLPLVNITTEWRRAALDHLGNDREPGQTDAYEVDLADIPRLEEEIDGTPVPPGVQFPTLEAARSAAFEIHMGRRAADSWIIDHYTFLGHFQELHAVPGDSPAVEDLGWRVLARHAGPIHLERDVQVIHRIKLDGPLTPE